MEKAQVGERQGTGSVPDRESQLGCQGDIEKMVTAVSKSMAEGRQKGEGHGKITLGRNYWNCLKGIDKISLWLFPDPDPLIRLTKSGPL